MDDVRVGFALGKIATIVVVDGMSVVNAFHLPRIREYVARNVIGRLLQVCLLIASMFVTPLWVCVLLWYIAAVVEYGFGFWAFDPKVVRGHTIAVPLDIAHMAERFGLLMMIVLGECILGQVIVDRATDARFLLHVMFGVCIAFLVHVRGCRERLFFSWRPGWWRRRCSRTSTAV